MDTETGKQLPSETGRTLPIESGKTLPEKRFSTGAISATIWNNDGKGRDGQAVTYNTIKLDRRYKDKDDNWQSTSSLRLHDLPKAALVLQKSYEHLVLKAQGTPSGVIEEIVI